MSTYERNEIVAAANVSAVTPRRELHRRRILTTLGCVADDANRAADYFQSVPAAV
jgi:hypothetical protein